MRIDIPSFGQSEVDRLQKVLGSQIDASRLAKLIAEIVAKEALEQAAGIVPPASTMTEQRQNRVRSILKELDADNAEIVVTALFKIPPSSARRLIETTAARFDIEMLDKIVGSVRAAFRDSRVRWLPEKTQAWEIPLSSSMVRKWIQEQISLGGQPPLRNSGRGGYVLLPDGSYRFICGVVEVTPKPRPKK
ncbi:hypothetical protein [Streptomyces olivochromogenes]|uniref:hypothetical protein n=1 Tax=Streptomyces olivochromogenes TaxID=1963 RepID=UPI001F446A64|nr:hypothetical protein [Streptomyces olivochromogenes]MCF3130233.1 hypothetical protein [Streptomyces olivochromogenes]